MPLPPTPTHGWRAPSVPGPPPSWSFTITLRHTPLGRIPLDEWSALRRGLYLTIHKKHNRQTSTPPAGFEPATPASERPQTHALAARPLGPAPPPYLTVTLRTGRGRMREKYDSILSHFRPVYTSSTFRFPRATPTNTVLTFLVSALELRTLSAHSMYLQTTTFFSNTTACSFAFRSGILLQLLYFEHYTSINLKYTFYFGTFFYILFCLAGTFQFITICRLSDGPRFVVDKQFSFVRKGR